MSSLRGQRDREVCKPKETVQETFNDNLESLNYVDTAKKQSGPVQ